MNDTAPALEGIAIVGVSASPSPVSRTALVAEEILRRLAERGATVRHIRLRELPPAALVAGDAGEPAIAAAVSALAGAAGVVIATPIYKAAYSGLLKLFLDLLPQFALAGKAVFPVATGGSLAHALALDYGLRPVLQSMGPRQIVQSLLLSTASLRVEGEAIAVDPAAALPLDEAIHHLACALTGSTDDPLLGHPRPDRHLAV